MIALGKHQLTVPIIQGGMGVGVSLGGLAGAVAACGGMGCISTANVGYQEADFASTPEQANLRALAKEIAKAKQLSGGAGLVAINAMVATKQYADAVKTAVSAGVDAVICGAGLPLDLPGVVNDDTVAIAPIVSSARAAKVICATWQKRFSRLPDFIVVEGSLAGGHLGFNPEQLRAGACQSLSEILAEVLAVVKPFVQSLHKEIPVFVAGGVYTAQDVSGFLKQGAAGVQMATRFIPTYECDASQAYKDVLLQATESDVTIVQSPVGMPGRALNTPLVQKVKRGAQFLPTHCSRCIKHCNPAEVPYCITHALIQAVQGNLDEGLFFCGSNVVKLSAMQHVADVINELKEAWR